MKRQPPTLGSPWAVLWLLVAVAVACLPAVSIAGNPGLGEGEGECDNERSCSADAEQLRQNSCPQLAARPTRPPVPDGPLHWCNARAGGFVAISATKVDNGVCDCCDGSDEPGSGTCSITCGDGQAPSALALAVRRSWAESSARIVAGLRSEVQSGKERLAVIQRQLFESNQGLETVYARLTAEKQANEREVHSRVYTMTSVDTFSTEVLQDIIVGVVTKEHHFPLLHSIAQQRCEATLGRECYLTPVTNTASLRLLLKEDVGRWPMDDLRFVLMSFVATAEVFSSLHAQLATRGVDIDTKPFFIDGTNSREPPSTAYPKKQAARAPVLDNTGMVLGSGDHAAPPAPPGGYHQDEPSRRAEVDRSEETEERVPTWAATFFNMVCPSTEVTDIHAKITTLQHEQAELATRVDRIEGELGQLDRYGPDLVYVAVKDATFERQVQGEVYKVTPFGQAFQGFVRLGDFAGWVSAGSPARQHMLFNNGLVCPGGKPRSLLVDFVCASQNGIVDVIEPSTCEYQAIVGTPAACPPPPSSADL